MHVNNILILLISVLLLGSCKKRNESSESSSSILTSQLDSLFLLSHQRGLLNGNIMISRDGNTFYTKSFGYTNTSKLQKLHKHSVFNIGSIAKQFNGVAIMMLIEEGKLSLDDPISKFDLELPDWCANIQIKHLLNYTSGLPSIDHSQTKNDEMAWKTIRESGTLLFVPGTQFKYDNSNVFIQKRIIEKISNLSYDDFLFEKIVKPLGLKNTHIDPSVDLESRTSCFDLEFNECPKFEFITGWPWLDVNDLLTWTQALNSNKLISAKSLNFLIKNEFFDNKSATLGEFIEKDQLHRHNGTSYHFESILLNDIKNEIIVIILSNQRNRVWDIGHEALNVMQGNTFNIPKKSICNAIRKACFRNIDTGIAFYHELKKTHLLEYNFNNPNELNRLGYLFLNKDMVREALQIFNLAISEFPDNANLYDSYGEAFFKNKQFNQALIQYQKSVELNPENQHGIDMIEKLKRLTN